MKKLVVLLAVVGLFASLTASAALAADQNKMNEVATIFAMRPVTVECHSKAEDPIIEQAWGYTYMDESVDYTVLDSVLCAQLAHPSSRKMLSLAVLVLVHESYHLRLWDLRYDETAVECRAIRHFTVGVQLLGFSRALAFQLLPNALRNDEKLPDQYHMRSCALPVA